MDRTLEAIYENGVLRPLEPLHLRERQRVLVTLSELPPQPADAECLDTDFVRVCAAEADESVGLDIVRAALAKIPGSLTADFAAEREDR